METKERYLFWKNHNNLDPNLRKELESLNDTQIEDAFFDDIKFGTAGMRGVMGVGSNRLNIHTIRKATLGFIMYLKNNNKSSVAIGYDNRHNSKEFAYDCAALLASNNIKVFLFDELRPTPELSFAVRYYKCDGGIMITASHNPKQYNGYKLYDETGCQLIPELADQVINEVNKIKDILAIKPNETFDSSLIKIINEEVDKAYYENVLSIQLRKDLKKDFKIIFSPEHGTSNIPVRHSLKEAGYDVKVVEEQAFPDPDFKNTETPNPEEKGAYTKVIELAKKENGDLILVCDPDGDRMGVGVKSNNEYYLFNGNQTGALLIEYILSTKKELNLIPKNPYIFNTVVTSDIGEAIANYYGVKCEKTLTGFKYIGNKVKQYEINKEKDYVFGYEESYGSLCVPFVRDKDATQACLLLAEACAYYLSSGKTLYDVLYDIFDKVGAYYDSQVSIMLPGADGAIKLQKIMEDLRKNPFNMDGYKTIKIEDYKLKKVTYKDGKVEDFDHYDKADVLKYYFDDGSFVAIRPSGTEPKCKIYLSTKANTYKEAEAKADFMKDFLSNIVK